MSENGAKLPRRHLLQLGILAGTAATLAVPLSALAGGSKAVATQQGHPSATPPPTPTPSASTPQLTGWTGRPTHPRTTPVGPTHTQPPLAQPPVTQPARSTPATRTPTIQPAPTWVHTWTDPISQLGEFESRSPSTRFRSNAIMLTIDDGPHPLWTPKYLRLLQRYHVQATFCVIGRQVLQYPDLVKAAVHDGHHIANHTFDHPLNLPRLSAAQIHAQLVDTNDAIVRATGFRPRQFRAPGGVWGPDVYAEVSRQQMMPLGWDIDPRDWSLPGVAHIRSAMLASRPHDIILCHDGGGDRSQTYAALQTVIPALLARGWRFVALPAPQSL